MFSYDLDTSIEFIVKLYLTLDLCRFVGKHVRTHYPSLACTSSSLLTATGHKEFCLVVEVIMVCGQVGIMVGNTKMAIVLLMHNDARSW